MSMNKELHRRQNALFKEIDQILKANARDSVDWPQQKGPFSLNKYVDLWYERYSINLS